MRSSDARLSYMASREPLISSDGPKNSSHCTESSESERASPRPMLQKTGPQHRINRGGCSSSPGKPSAPFPTVRNNVKPFHSTGPQRPLAHSKVSADAKTKTWRCPSRERPSRASSHAAQLSFLRKHTHEDSDKALLSCATHRVRNKNEARTKLRGTHTTAASRCSCAMCGTPERGQGRASDQQTHTSFESDENVHGGSARVCDACGRFEKTLVASP